MNKGRNYEESYSGKENYAEDTVIKRGMKWREMKRREKQGKVEYKKTKKRKRRGKESVRNTKGEGRRKRGRQGINQSISHLINQLISQRQHTPAGGRGALHRPPSEASPNGRGKSPHEVLSFSEDHTTRPKTCSRHEICGRPTGLRHSDLLLTRTSR